MTRKTRAELEAERQEMLALSEAHEFAQYPTRLMAALELATKEFYYELSVENSVFVLRDRNERRPEAVAFTLAHTRASQTALVNLEWDLQEKAALQAEAERVRLARAAALSKLTLEEKELLNLN